MAKKRKAKAALARNKQRRREGMRELRADDRKYVRKIDRLAAEEDKEEAQCAKQLRKRKARSRR